MKNKVEFSKKICIFSLTIFSLSIFFCVILNFLVGDTSIFAYLIPATTTLSATSAGFYYNKAKAENLSKQKLRNILLKFILEEKLSEDDYFEICQEIDNIDDTISAKLSSMYEETVNEDTTVSV